MNQENRTLFRPISLAGITLANRVVMAPMTRARADGETGVPSDSAAIYYGQRASAGLTISEATVISLDATGYINVPGLYSASQVKGWRAVTDSVHAKGGRIFSQLWHVGPISHPDLLDGRLPLSPSGVNPQFMAYTREGPKNTVTPKVMTVEDIERTIEEFRLAALNAVAAGFDGIELHAANAYLIHQFLNPATNKRTDSYGGNHVNRSRLLFEVLDAVSTVVPSGRIAVRLNPAMDGIAGIVLDAELRRTLEFVTVELDKRNLAFLDLCVSTFDPERDSLATTVELGRHYRELFGGTLAIGGMLTADTAETLVEEGTADLVVFGRPYVANPDLVRRLREGLPLAEPVADSLYQGGNKGYIDYPCIDDTAGR